MYQLQQEGRGHLNVTLLRITNLLLGLRKRHGRGSSSPNRLSRVPRGAVVEGKCANVASRCRQIREGSAQVGEDEPSVLAIP